MCTGVYVRACAHACNNIVASVVVTKNTCYVSGACDDADCEQLCFPVARGRTCGCAIGFTLNADETSCDSGKRSRKQSYVTSFSRHK